MLGYSMSAIKTANRLYGVWNYGFKDTSKIDCK